MSLLDTVKTVVKNYCDSIKMADVVYGTMQSEDTIKLDNYTQVLPSQFVVVPDHLKKHDVQLTLNGETKTYTMQAQIKAGDRVVCAKKLGGQLYVVIGKVA